MQIQPVVWGTAFNTVVGGGAAYLFFGWNGALWWVALTGVFYGLIALNSIIRLELKQDADERRAKYLEKRHGERREPYFEDDAP